MNTVLQWAQAYQAHGFRVFPYAPGTRVPLKGSHPSEDATTNQEQAAKWWGKRPDYNVGLWLRHTHILMLDVDTGHTNGADGFDTLRKLSKDIGPMPATYWETSPSGGCHFFFTYPESMELTEGQNLFADTGEDGKPIPSGIDFNAIMVPVAPSQYNGGRCIPAKDKAWGDMAPAPEWLLKEIERQRNPGSFTTTANSSGKKWAGKLLDEIVNGAPTGTRNSFLTSLAGKMFWTGADPQSVYNLLLIANDNFLDDPLPEKEVNAVFKSVLKKEERRRAYG